MARVSHKATIKAPKGEVRFVLRLYVTGDTPISTRAIANLHAICETHLPRRHSVEVIDVLGDALRAMTDGILVTPTLVRVSPLPVSRIIGDLSDSTIVLHALGVEVA